MTRHRDRTIPESFHTLFWDFDPESIDLVVHSDFIMGRIMELGSWDSMKWLLGTYTKDQILSYLNNRGKRILPPRELNYWLFIIGISSQERQNWLKASKEQDNVWNNRSSH